MNEISSNMAGSLKDDPFASSWDTGLTAEEMEKADAFADSIDIRDSNAVMNFGTGLQKKMSAFPDKAMSSVLEGDLGEIDKMLTGLAEDLRAFAESGRKKGLKALFGRKKVSDVLKSGYA
ncbi:MAG: toxic anion resistance protein, partial [Lachnospiraceae bacterium]|nr:toxic anion resistance protein [Lachnospiraceae bacterium]